MKNASKALNMHAIAAALGVNMKMPYISKGSKHYLNKKHPGVKNPKIVAHMNMMHEKWRAKKLLTTEIA